MTLPDNRHLRRALALAILLLPMFLIWKIMVMPLLDRYLDAEAAIEQSVQLLSRYRANAAHKGQLAEMGLARRQDLAQVRGFLDGQNQPLASSTLQTTVRRLAEANGGSVRSLAAQPSAKDAGFDRLTVRVELAVGADRMIDILQAIETSASPSLLINSLDVRAPDQGAAPQKADGNTSLTVRLDIAGYWVPK